MDAIICFTRVPKAGQTKTRLMPCLTGEQCAELHWAFLRDLGKIYDSMKADLLVAHTQDPDWEQLKAVFPAARFFPQEGKDLGEKMNHALNLVLSMGYEKCILTGSDLPLMTKAHETNIKPFTFRQTGKQLFKIGIQPICHGYFV